jgi:leader peptidase (prepilin peptidase)/N-methyltransferase
MLDWTDPSVTIAFAIVLGLIIGSFLNVVIARLPMMLEREWRSECRELLAEDEGSAAARDDATEALTLVSPRSRCPSCGSPVRALDNIPVLSWLLLRGRCRTCGEPISVQYPLVEAFTALVAVLVVLRFGPTPYALLAIAFSWILIPAAVIDLRTTLLPDTLTLPLLWLGLVVAVTEWSPVSPADAIVGAAIGYLVLWALYHVFRILTGKEGMGYGDFKLLAALGAWVGWQGLPLVILLSSGVGAVLGLLMIALQGRDRAAPIPFGPFLAAGGWIALLWGDRITSAYLAWSLG